MSSILKMAANMQRPPTKEEAWAAFWEILAPALVDAHRRGLVPSTPAEWDAFNAARARSGLPRTERHGYRSSDVRAWLRAQGRSIHSNGRIPNQILDEFEAAMGIDQEQ